MSNDLIDKVASQAVTISKLEAKEVELTNKINELNEKASTVYLDGYNLGITVLQNAQQGVIASIKQQLNNMNLPVPGTPSAPNGDGLQSNETNPENNHNDQDKGNESEQNTNANKGKTGSGTRAGKNSGKSGAKRRTRPSRKTH